MSLGGAHDWRATPPRTSHRACNARKSLRLRAVQHETTGPLPLQIAYNAASPGYVNAEVAKHIDEVQIFELNNNLQQAIAANNVQEIKRTAEAIEAKGNILGPRAAKKTMLARQALLEINAGGRVSKKTQLALADSARLAEEMPTS